MTHVVNDRIAARAAELAALRHQQESNARLAKERAQGAEVARRWLANGPVKAGARFRPTRQDLKALGS